MDQRRINLSDLAIGQPLPWNVHDVNGKLLLNKGYIVQHSQQIDTLLERGMYVEASALQQRSSDPAPKPRQEPPSALRLINLCSKRLERLLFNLGNEENVQGKILEVAETILFPSYSNPDVALATILLNQDAGSYPVRHCIDTAIVSALVARSLGKTKDECLLIAAAAMTMNVGMLRIQDQLQNSRNALSELEAQAVKDHPLQSVEMLQQVGIDNKDWLSWVLLHHENEDGSGYPTGKSAQEIPQNAKIISIADRYCARVAVRAYRKSLLPNAALRDILMADKKNVDTALAATFIKVLGVYPTGTFVRLENGEIGVVTGKGESSTTPYVHTLIGPRGAPLSFAIKRDTSKALFAIREVLNGAQAAVRFDMQQLWGNDARL